VTDRPIIGATLAESVPAFEATPRPPSGAPNVVLVVLDDLGFGQLGCFGSDLATPTIDRLAAEGVRYNRFHVTALCSPTRACLLTGRNHHAVGMGFLTDVPTGFPGYNGRIPASAAALPRIQVRSRDGQVEASEPLVRCKGAARTYGSGPSATVALQPTDCEIWDGARVALVGESGSGKSTLAKTLLGIESPDPGGNVELDEHALAARSANRPTSRSATASWSQERSTPITSHPASASSGTALPVPQPRSRHRPGP